jgi:uncharacterized protein (DUF58 family)
LTAGLAAAGFAVTFAAAGLAAAALAGAAFLVTVFGLLFAGVAITDSLIKLNNRVVTSCRVLQMHFQDVGHQQKPAFKSRMKLRKG